MRLTSRISEPTAFYQLGEPYSAICATAEEELSELVLKRKVFFIQ